MPLRSGFGIGLCLAGSLAAAGLASAADLRVSYFKEERPLVLDVTRLAVWNPGAAPDLGRFGIPASAVSAYPISGWWLAATPEGSRSAAGALGLVKKIARSGGAAFVSPVFVGIDGGPLIPTQDILVRFEASLSPAGAETILRASGAGTVLDRDWGAMPRAYRLRSGSRSGLDVLAAANALAARSDVMFAEPDMIFTGRGGLIPNDPGFPNLWGIHNTGQFGGTPDMDMDGPDAWDITSGDPGVLVVVLDTGVQQDHPDIHQAPGTDTTSDAGDGGPMNACDNHGTTVAGCVSAKMNNSLGTVGICPGCRVASARTFISNLSCDGTWMSQSSWTVDSLAWAVSIGARVTNNSNRYDFTSAAITQKYLDTRNDGLGLVHFASAGNDHASSLWYPASLPSVNAVAALDENGNRTAFSNYGPGLDFSAPGIDVYTTDRTGAAGYGGDDYVFVLGTSFASPYAAGVAGLVLSQAPSLTVDQVEARLRQGAVDLGAPGYDTDFGWGFVNGARSLVQPSLSVADTAVNEGNTGTTSATFTVSLSFPVAGAVTVAYATANGSATSGSDYLPFAGTLTFPPGATSHTIFIPVIGDVLDEDNETFVVNLSSPSGASIADGQAVATILDDDPTPTLSIQAPAPLAEGAQGTSNSMVFTVVLSAASGKVVTVAYATADGVSFPATAGQDYQAVSGTLTFDAGATTSNRPMVTILGDNLDEYDETFSVTLSSPTNATIVTGTAVGTIVDDDPVPSLTVSDVSVPEGDEPPGVSAYFVASLNTPSGRTVSVNYATANGTATAGQDYTATSGTLSLPALTTAAVVGVPLTPDTTWELSETLFLNLSNPVNVTIADGQGAGVIFNDDPVPNSVVELSHAEAYSASFINNINSHLYRLSQKGQSSYEVVVDSTSGDIGDGDAGAPLRLERVAWDGATVLQSSLGIGATGAQGGGIGFSRTLRWQNTGATANGQFIRVASGQCGPVSCNDNVYRIRLLETTCFLPRFNNSGTQTTTVILQNVASYPVNGTLWFWSSAGSLLTSQAFTLNAKALSVLNTSTLSGLAGAAGSISVSHDGRYGDLTGKSVSLETGTGFTGDSPLEPRR